MGSATAFRIAQTALKWVLATMLAMMVLLIFGNVVLRYGFGSSIILADEMSRLLFVWLTFIGAIAAMLENEHIGADFVIRMLSRRGRTVVSLISSAVIVGLMLVTCYGTAGLIGTNWSATLPVSGLSVTVQFFPVMLFALFAIGIVVWKIQAFARGKLSADALIYMPEVQHVAETISADAGRADLPLHVPGRP